METRDLVHTHAEVVTQMTATLRTALDFPAVALDVADYNQKMHVQIPLRKRACLLRSLTSARLGQVPLVHGGRVQVLGGRERPSQLHLLAGGRDRQRWSAGRFVRRELGGRRGVGQHGSGARGAEGVGGGAAQGAALPALRLEAELRGMNECAV